MILADGFRLAFSRTVWVSAFARGILLAMEASFQEGRTWRSIQGTEGGDKRFGFLGMAPGQKTYLKGGGGV